MTLPKAKAEAAELQKLMDKEGKGEKLEAWDWWYYTEKLRKEKYDLEEDQIKPILQIRERTRRRFCRCQQTLWHYADKTQQYPCLSSRCRSLRGKRCRRLAIRHLLRRLLPASRQERRSMDEQLPRQKGDIRPLVCNVASFTKPVGDTPSLLTMDEVGNPFP